MFFSPVNHYEYKNTSIFKIIYAIFLATSYFENHSRFDSSFSLKFERRIQPIADVLSPMTSKQFFVSLFFLLENQTKLISTVLDILMN